MNACPQSSAFKCSGDLSIEMQPASRHVGTGLLRVADTTGSIIGLDFCRSDDQLAVGTETCTSETAVESNAWHQLVWKDAPWRFAIGESGDHLGMELNVMLDNG